MKLNKKRLAALVAFSVCASIAGQVTAAEAGFADVKQSHWAFGSIQKAVADGIVTGYPDHSFHPAQSVTQSEWLAMLERAYEPADFKQPGSGSPWDAAYVSYAKSKGWKLLPAGGVLSRGQAAGLAVNAIGRNYGEDDSVQYLLDTELASGQTRRTVEGYGKEKPLTRAEAVTFIQRLKEKLPKLESAPGDRQTYDRSENVYVYRNEQYKFTLAMPLSWKNAFEVEKDAEKDILYFARVPKSRFGGIVFAISTRSKESWEANKDNVVGEYANLHVLGELAGQVYVFAPPTDVEWDPEDKAETEAYQKMAKEAFRFWSTFEFIK
ncbi:MULTISPECIES: S-layer homology domain-containing protein [unclassified Paenibacillus]|uniref:S-layer homology domain-containing protein n=1 Tax=unclassified Paenibacillus TaxID=185978 RepID=UPI0009566729|nr:MULTISPECIES: S-layer homology domain-containing protein [unclassified Paenibacillus]ASS68668.1 S-layer homology domain-containing protein [Paenibacillus sp. RUD330]SIR55373.1 S-layer homology domain-containing protein [Paenibacillus sp. RU4X]SIR63910.1 S-layer homology domain-containing protein [Paenibacillus sp. RU4T]